MTRILVLSNFYPPHSHGGYEMSCADVMDRLVRRGHEVTVLTSRYRRPGVPDTAGTVTVRRDLDLYWDDHRVVVPPRRRRAAIEAANQRRLRRALAASRPDVVSIWNMGAMSMGLLRTLARSGVPLVYAVCNDWLVWGPGMDAWCRGWSDRPRLARAVERVTGLATDAGDLGTSGIFLFVSDFTRRWAEEHSAWRFPDSAVVYSGIDPTDFPLTDRPLTDRPLTDRPLTDRPLTDPPLTDPPLTDRVAADAPAGPWRWRLLYVGRLEPDKGVDTAVEALAHLPAEATLEVIGPGSAEERRRVEDGAVRAGVIDRVSFSDLPRAQLAPRYRAVDVFVFPSRWEEPFGLVPIEAMACGIPVVATRTGGSAEFLTDGFNCLGFPRQDPEALAAAVTRLAGDADLRALLTANGHETARHLTVDRLADSFEEWLVGAATGFPAGRPRPRRLPGAPTGAAG